MSDTNMSKDKSSSKPAAFDQAAGAVPPFAAAGAEAATKMEEERNEINWRIVEKDRNKISSMIEGVGRVNNMEEVAMTCANMCGVQLAMIDIAVGKPILY